MRTTRGTLAGVGFLFLAACGGKVVGMPGDPTPDPTVTTVDPAPPTTYDPYPMPPPSPTSAPSPSPTSKPPAPLDPPAGLPPTRDVPCAAGAVVELSFPISAVNMNVGAGDGTGPGWCYGSVKFAEDLSNVLSTTYSDYSSGQHEMVWAQANGSSTCPALAPGAYHCGTLRYGSGRIHPQYCSIFALCENGRARATSFTW